MRIAIVGTGISGLACADRLRAEHDITVFEASDWIGGHTHTVDVEVEAQTIPVDTGFIVFNRGNYPNFSSMLDRIGVESAATDMSFSFRCDAAGLEYGGRSLAGLFAQRRNAYRPRFWSMLNDIRRFGPKVRRAASHESEEPLGEYLDRSRLSRGFIEDYLLPMAGAIWSAPPARIREFPLGAFVGFFDNHGMLEPWRAPRWRYVVGGSRTYVEALTAPFRDRIRTSTPVRSIERTEDGVAIEFGAGGVEWYDEVVLACHSDQALSLLASPTDAERQVLGAIPYQSNEVVLHTDPGLLPRRRAAWSAWNYHTFGDDHDRVAVTYNMNILQRLPVSTTVNVTLNATDSIDPDHIVSTYTYDHPVYTRETLAAQARWVDISSTNRTHYCGAYWGYGFHEDGTRSGLRVADTIDALPKAKGAAA